MQTMLEELLAGIVEEPLAEDRWLVLADWLEEHDDPRRAELLRLDRKMIATCCEPEKHPERAAGQARMVELLAAGVEPCVPRRTVLLGQMDELPMVFCFIPPGSFCMGSVDHTEGPFHTDQRHRVTLTKGYWMGMYTVTQAQWLAVLGNDPSRFKGESVPVESISWDECQRFCRKLSERGGGRYRLPTEAEWEHACRAGTTTPFFLGNTITSEQANYNGRIASAPFQKGTYRQRPTRGGHFPPNAWGLYDMHGNVWEWCQDRRGWYPSEPVSDPQGGTSGTARIKRGGSWHDDPSRLCSGWRDASSPGDRNSNTGCRLVLCPD